MQNRCHGLQHSTAILTAFDILIRGKKQYMCYYEIILHKYTRLQTDL